jgi:hypothetical protein
MITTYQLYFTVLTVSSEIKLKSEKFRVCSQTVGLGVFGAMRSPGIARLGIRRRCKRAEACTASAAMLGSGARPALSEARGLVSAAREGRLGVFEGGDPLKLLPFELRFLGRRQPPTGGSST